MKCVGIPDKIKLLLEKDGGLEALIRTLPDIEEIHSQSRIFHALSDPTRLLIIHLLNHHPLCVCVIRDIVKISDSKLSYHLSVLQKSDLIDGEREGNWVIYDLTERGRKYSCIFDLETEGT
jgi:DNA-binding transcriptional ArsR family regulator